jgi:hypothetical protein
MSRPQFNPTKEQRDIVKSMAAVGIPHEQIALKIGVRSPKTLRKYFRHELDLGAIDANYKVAKALFEMATSGEHPGPTIFWMKAHAGWHEGPTFQPPAVPPEFKVVCEQKGGPA